MSSSIVENKIEEDQDNAAYSPTVSMISSYIKSWFGSSQPKITKRSLSEEAECGSPESLSEWIKKGSNVDEIDAYGYTPLVNASLRGCAKSVKILLNNGAEIDKKAMHGYTALHAAAQNGHLEVVRILCENRANLEARNDDSDTPLMLAVRSEHQNVVNLLCEKGAEIRASGFNSQDPVNYAINKHNMYVTDILQKHELERNLHNSVSSTSDSNYNRNSSNSVFDGDK
jgi:ankyrin repeat protein